MEPALECVRSRLARALGRVCGFVRLVHLGSSGPSQLVPLAEERARGDEAGARRARGTRRTAHIFIVDVSSAVDQLTDLRVVPVKCGIEQVGHLRALFREPLC